MLSCALGSVASAIYFYQGHTAFNTGFLLAAVLAGAVTAGFYGFFPIRISLEPFPHLSASDRTGICV